MIYIAHHRYATALLACCILLIAAASGLAKSIPPPNGINKEIAPNRFTTLRQTLESEAGAQFETLIRFRQKREFFVYASTSPEGSGGFTTEAIFWIAPDGSIHRIDSERADRGCQNKVKHGEVLLAGGPGILFSNGVMRFVFLIANEGDPHCCPTAGSISGTYKITGKGQYDRNSKQYISTFQLVVDKCRRDNFPSDDSANR